MRAVGMFASAFFSTIGAASARRRGQEEISLVRLLIEQTLLHREPLLRGVGQIELVHVRGANLPVCRVCGYRALAGLPPLIPETEVRVERRRFTIDFGAGGEPSRSAMRTSRRASAMRHLWYLLWTMKARFKCTWPARG